MSSSSSTSPMIIGDVVLPRLHALVLFPVVLLTASPALAEPSVEELAAAAALLVGVLALPSAFVGGSVALLYRQAFFPSRGESWRPGVATAAMVFVVAYLGVLGGIGIIGVLESFGGPAELQTNVMTVLATSGALVAAFLAGVYVWERRGLSRDRWNASTAEGS